MDSEDPSCPDCGEPISATSIYCMHCGADVDGQTSDSDPTASSDDGLGTSLGDGLTTSLEDSSAPILGDVIGLLENLTPDADEQTTDRTSRTTHDERLLDPDGIIDNSLTAFVGVCGGLLVGVATSFLFLIDTQHPIGLLPGVLAWVASTGYLATRETVGEAVQYGCYAVAVVLVLYPTIAFSPALKDGNFGGRIALFLVGEAILGLGALVVAGVGYTIGNR